MSFLRRVMNAIGRRWLALRCLPASARLRRTQSQQIDAFYTFRCQFMGLYEELKGHDVSRFLTDAWREYNARLERVLLLKPPITFLRKPLIAHTMFVREGGRPLAVELAYLRMKLSEENLKRVLQEDCVGRPVLMNARLATSHNSIHHLYHVLRFLDGTGSDLEELQTVVEWGGGYGNLAKIFRRLNAAPVTYIIIDTPLISCLQWLYLASVVGSDEVNLVTNDRSPGILNSKINLVPLCFVDEVAVEADLFVSTWALSESSRFAQDYVRDRSWFNAKHLLLAYQESSGKFPDAGRIGPVAQAVGAVTEEIDFLPNNRYAFR